MLKDKNSVVKLVDSLEEKKLVRRVNSPDDRRRNLIKVTAKAERIKEDVTDIALRAVEKTTAGISDEDMQTFISVLDRMAQNMDKKVDLLGMAEKFPTRPVK
jgi:hypothetical protein